MKIKVNYCTSQMLLITRFRDIHDDSHVQTTAIKWAIKEVMKQLIEVSRMLLRWSQRRLYTAVQQQVVKQKDQVGRDQWPGNVSTPGLRRWTSERPINWSLIPYVPPSFDYCPPPALSLSLFRTIFFLSVVWFGYKHRENSQQMEFNKQFSFLNVLNWNLWEIFEENWWIFQ